MTGQESSIGRSSSTTRKSAVSSSAAIATETTTGFHAVLMAGRYRAGLVESEL